MRRRGAKIAWMEGRIKMNFGYEGGDYFLIITKIDFISAPTNFFVNKKILKFP